MLENNTTEQHLLEMSEHFKQILDKKTKDLNRLKKFVALIYGLVRATDDQEDISLIETIRGYLSEEICWIMDIEIEEED